MAHGQSDDASDTPRIAVIGLGYVGLPVAVAFARAFPGTLGFDIDAARIAELKRGRDRTGEVDRQTFLSSGLEVTGDPAQLAAADTFIITVPTPVDKSHRPDLGALRSACDTVGGALRPGALVVFESTVYPGVTEEICGPRLAAASGLRQGQDFKLGYSPERINPGDRMHRLESITKVVSGEDSETLERVAALYDAIVEAGIHRAPSIKVAEAAKVIENTQRDLNIALMNELALIFDRLGLRSADVLAAARTKWNFLPFTPGLVGGHCIGVDPYYLTSKAQEVGYDPQVILAGRRINDGMGAFVAERVVKLLVKSARPLTGARVGLMGLTFKENVPDLRNSRVIDVIEALRDFGIEPMVHDPVADPAEVRAQYGLDLVELERLDGLDAIVLAVPHGAYMDGPLETIVGSMTAGAVVADVKSVLSPAALPEGLVYWSL
ncbi:MAG: nucleotide sugar dehydrogenase [Rhodovibrionaceae bacterium]|nr:nucleotide sugar dehydrogenase [Rhodovibrionaceae bacterium]